MILIDVNVLVYAFREDAPKHTSCRDWLVAALAGDHPVAIPEVVLSGFVRIVPHPGIFKPPTPLDAALAFAAGLRERVDRLDPGPRHWDIFTRLCRETNARGNLVPDAYLAAIAIENDAEWITTDRAFARFPGLRTRHPLS